MAEVVELDGTLDALVKHLNASCPDWYPADKRPTPANVKLIPVGMDDRIGWDTYLVTAAGEVWGQTDGPVKP